MIYDRQIDTALAMLRRGRAVILRHAGVSIACLSAELATQAVWRVFDPQGSAELIVARERLTALGYDVVGMGDAVPVRVDGPLSLEIAKAIANPLLDSTMAVPRLLVRRPDDHQLANAALRLAKLAELLPTLIVRPAESVEGPTIDAEDILSYSPPQTLALVSSAPLPIDVDASAHLYAFASSAGPDLHIALVIGEPDLDAPLVRLHSECLTGDVFGSKRCDCGPQLAAAKQAMVAAGGGVIIYLRQEGRNIGLANKLRAYVLQGRGLDTYEANFHVGFGADDRDYEIAAGMLRWLGYDRVKLLTNNPAKPDALKAAGIVEVTRVPLQIDANPHNERYLAAKRDLTGHQL